MSPCVQSNGGPCGILAALVAFMLKDLMFEGQPPQAAAKRPRVEGDPPPDGPRASSPSPDPAVPAAFTAPLERREQALVHAISTMLWQAGQSHEGAAVVVAVDGEHVPCDRSTPADAFTATTHASEGDVQSAVAALLPVYETPSGIVLVVLSLLLSRGLPGVKADMDEPDTHLVQRFGQGSQELLNLAITGRATSGVFDGSKSLLEGMPDADPAMADLPGMSVRGVLHRPDIGYLTQLEALRYTNVGTYFKEPAFPLFVLASSSHYSVLFATDPDSIQASPSSMARRAFGAADGTGGGMIPPDKLREVLLDKNLNVQWQFNLKDSPFRAVANDPAKLTALSTHLDKGGFILWSDFWKAVEPVCTGRAEALTVPAPAPAPAPAIPASGTPRDRALAAFNGRDTAGGQFLDGDGARAAMRDLGLTAGGTGDPATLWATMDQLGDSMGIVFFDVFFSVVEPHIPAPAPAPAIPPAVPLARTDSEVARQLQESEFGGSATGGTGGVAGPLQPGQDSVAAVQATPPPGDFDSAQLTRELTLYHYNGLEGGSRLPRCVRLTVRQLDVGAGAAGEGEAVAALASIESALQASDPVSDVASPQPAVSAAPSAGQEATPPPPPGASTEEAAVAAAVAAADASEAAEKARKRRKKDIDDMQSVLRTKWVGATIMACHELVLGEGGLLTWVRAPPPKID